MPTLFAGIRTATIAIVATATIGTIAGFTTLGDFIINESIYGENGVLAGAIMVALLALVLEGRPGAPATPSHPEGSQAPSDVTCPTNTQGGNSVRIDRTRMRMALAGLLVLALALAVAACGGGGSSSSETSEAEGTSERNASSGGAIESQLRKRRASA